MTKSEETVVLVHGLGSNRLDMWPISKRLRKTGFQVQNWGYRSVGNRIETHALRLGELLSELDKNPDQRRFHLVTHSMGGIIARAVFESHQFQKLGRVVMLAPPHQGSHVARKMIPIFGWLSPSLGQISDDPGSYVNRLPNSLKQNNIEFGIVEASKDRVIASGRVLLDGYHDFARIEGHHGVMAWYPETIRLVESFLTKGEFSTEASDVQKPAVSDQSRSPAALSNIGAN